MRTRVITAIVLLAISVPIIIIGGIPLYLLGSFLSLVAIYELIRMRENEPKENKIIPFEAKLFSFFGVLYLVFADINIPEIIQYKVDMNTLIVTIFFILLVVLIRETFSINTAGFTLISILYVGLCFHSLLFLRIKGLEYLIYILLIISFTDTFAYFFGVKFGKHKIAPKISPKKSYEGSIAGALFGTVIGVVFGYFYLPYTVGSLIIMSFIVSCFGQIGDLVASSIKRRYKIKDFGNIFPGHGGVLDRLDSALFASLALYFIIQFFSVLVV